MADIGLVIVGTDRVAAFDGSEDAVLVASFRDSDDTAAGASEAIAAFCLVIVETALVAAFGGSDGAVLVAPLRDSVDTAAGASEVLELSEDFTGLRHRELPDGSLRPPVSRGCGAMARETPLMLRLKDAWSCLYLINCVDIFTKALVGAAFARHRSTVLGLNGPGGSDAAG
jgi:hypothetical protein